MRLFYSPFSPFARKVRACAIARGIDHLISLAPTSGEAPELVAFNPLGKLPCLVTDDGTALFDSRVICEFLDGVGSGSSLCPEGALRIRALRSQALGDGISDAAVLRRGLMGYPPSDARDAALAAQRAKVDRSLAVLENSNPPLHVDIGTISVACALGYLDVRYADEPWRPGRSKLDDWFAEMMQQPCLANTLPG